MLVNQSLSFRSEKPRSMSSTNFQSSIPAPAAIPSKIAFDRKRVYQLAKNLADDNRFYFQCISSSQFRQRFSSACETISKNVAAIESFGEIFATQMAKFDFDETCPGNGYRSVAAVVDSCVLNCIRLLKDIKELRDTMLFRANHFSKELEAYTAVLDALKRDLECVKDYTNLWTPGDLFPPEEARPKLNALMDLIESFDHSCFYGRCIGFQYCSSLYRVFQVIGISLASYSMLWESGNRETWSSTASALFKTGRFVLNPEERAQRITNVITNADISFCKSFWGLTESPLLQDLPKWFCPQMALNEIWSLPCQESLYLENTEGKKLKITPPTAHTGPKPLPLRVMTFKLREGMPTKSTVIKNSIDGLAPKSPYLLFHCHGGGFVATSSKTHEIYLRHWAKLLDCTVVSVDYSLAPENPYPRAVEETLYAYAWVLNNAERLGWTGERICFVGDSAGGHLLTATTLRAIQMKVRRLPDGLVLVYSPFLIEYNPSPSRLLSFCDPLLPPGITARCIAAYIGEKEQPIRKLKESPIKTTPLLPQNRPKLTDYAANLKKETHHSKTTQNSATNDEIINFCVINRPSPTGSIGSQTEENSPVDFSVKVDDDSSKEEADDKILFEIPSPPSKILSSTGKCQVKTTRQRSLSDPTFDSPVDGKLLESEFENEDDVVSEFNQEISTVKIQKDPRRIVLSTSAYDQNFIDYLSQHELTRKTLVRLQVPSLKKQSSVNFGSSSASFNDGPSSAKLPRVDNPGTSTIGGHVRSYSTGSLSFMSSSIGSTFGTVTGYAIDALSGFLDSTTTPTSSVCSPAVNASVSSTPGSTSSDNESVLSQFHNLQVPKDPFLSPLHADDALIEKFPPTALVACHLDPLLDDSIAFAKKLKRNNVKVSLDLLDSLPHGFLNFTLWSSDCRAAAKFCLQRIREKLNVPAADSAPFDN